MTDNVNTVAKLKKNDKKTNERSTKYYTENKILHIKQNTTQKTKDYTENKILLILITLSVSSYFFLHNALFNLHGGLHLWVRFVQHRERLDLVEAFFQNNTSIQDVKK
jgi:hypothetical protein